MTTWRRLFAPAVMASALLAGAYGMLVAPVNKRLGEARAEARLLAEQLRSSEAACLRVAEFTEAERRTAEEAARMERDSRLATDRTGVFDGVTSLAVEHGVTLGRVDPLEEPHGAQRQSPAIAPRARAAYSIEVRGPYGAVAAFLRDLQTTLGFTVVRSVRLTPAEDGPEGDTIAVIVSDHVAFDASPATPADGGGP